MKKMKENIVTINKKGFKSSCNFVSFVDKYLILFILSFFLLIASFVDPSYAQEFTATAIGDYGNVTVMEVTGNGSIPNFL